MTSRLSSLLVRDGLIGVSRMEYVYQRQVIDGGALDTILLELELVEDGRLQQYLSLATDLPVANGSVESLSNGQGKELVKACNQETANKYQVVPIGISDAGLEVVVCEPVNVEKLESLADEIDMPVQPKVAPEYRYRVNYAAVYGEDTDERFSKLAARAQTLVAINTPLPPPAAVSAPVHSAPTVTFNDSTAADNDSTVADKIELAVSVVVESAVPQRIEPDATQPADTTERVRGKRAPAEQPKRRQTMEMPAIAVESSTPESDSEVVAAEATTGADSDATPIADAAPSTESEQSVPAMVYVRDQIESITPEEARVFLGQSEDRDEIFEILLRALAGRARYAALFTIKGKVAKGRVALTPDGFDNEDIRKVSVALDVSSRFQTVVNSKAFSIGSLDTEDAGVLEALALIGGGTVPKSMLLIPIVMRERVIAIAIGHNAGRGIAVRKVTELLPLGRATADAVSSLLAKMRAAKAGNAVPTAPADDGATIKNTVASIDSNSVPAPDAEMVALFDAIEGDDSDKSQAAIVTALKIGEKTIAHLDFCFPGKLLKTRHDQDAKLTPAEYGPVLDLVTQIGPSCGVALREKMRDADREVRYYATLCASAIEAPDVVNEFVERLFDGDEAIREMAIDALAKYPKDAVHSALDFVRRALHSEDNGRLKLATSGLAVLGDVSAIPDLIDAHSRGGEAAELTQHALFLLTNQDHGSSNRQWRSWWEKNEGGNRIEWMLSGLSSKNANERKNAAEVLRKITGEFFGYGHDLPKKQREKARKKWQSWWKSQNK